MELHKVMTEIQVGPEYSTHHVSDEQAMNRIKKEGKTYVVIGNYVLEWLDQVHPMPTKEIIEAKESELTKLLPL